jgi:hypothetical protein
MVQNEQKKLSTGALFEKRSQMQTLSLRPHNVPKHKALLIATIQGSKGFTETNLKSGLMPKVHPAKALVLLCFS